ncbi:hypothetical protein BKG82_27620 [Mycobacteroides chelonae]|uniref:Uncharacterized protein n=1 Tax=Mycobacteroides chelonae TaxID=1774 RepID=A0A1S1LGF0_MYCCH|nr:hypothetical protein BKG82_27620 [Mycobacteroides chelonae]
MGGHMTESSAQPENGSVRRLLGIGLLLAGAAAAVLFAAASVSAVQDARFSMVFRCGIACLGVVFVVMLLGVATVGHVLFTQAGRGWFRNTVDLWTKTTVGQLLLACSCFAMVGWYAAAALSGQSSGFTLIGNSVLTVIWGRVGVRIVRGRWHQWSARSEVHQGPSIERIP